METDLLLANEKDRYSLLVFQNRAFLHPNRQKKKSYQNNAVCLLQEIVQHYHRDM